MTEVSGKQAIQDAILNEKVEKSKLVGDFSIMDLIYQEWLRNRFEVHDIKLKTDGPYSQLASAVFNEYSGITYNSTNPFSVLLDHHGARVKEVLGSGRQCPYGHFEVFPSAVKQMVHNMELPTDSKGNPDPKFDKEGLFRFFDGVLTKVLIVDERIQESFESNYYPENSGEFTIKKGTLFACANVFTPNKEVFDLNQSQYQADCFDLLAREIESISRLGQLVCVDIVVIHLGVVEKMLSSAGKPKGATDVELFLQELQSRVNFQARFVITSGRGKPDNLPHGLQFIAFSALSQFCIETPFKSFLIQALQSSRCLSTN
jgi:hypothetical protein